MSLREDLARRFRVAAVQDYYIGVVPDKEPDKEWLRVADEAIRFAEWNKAEICHRDRMAEGYDDRKDAEEDAKNFGLTLPPEGWKP